MKFADDGTEGENEALSQASVSQSAAGGQGDRLRVRWEIPPLAADQGPEHNSSHDGTLSFIITFKLLFIIICTRLYIFSYISFFRQLG